MQAETPSDSDLFEFGQQSIDKLKAIIENPKWQKFDDKPCVMLKMEIGDRIASRGEAVVNFSIDQVCEFLQRQDTLKKLNDQLVSIKYIYVSKQTKNQCNPKVVHQRYKGIWPVQDRDFVAVTALRREGNTIYMSAQSFNYPFPEQKKVTRAKIIIGGYMLEKIDDKSTKVTYISDSDLCGSIPGMIKKQISKKQGTVASRIEDVMKGK